MPSTRAQFPCVDKFREHEEEEIFCHHLKDEYLCGILSESIPCMIQLYEVWYLVYKPTKYTILLWWM
jgi:hypothetical protein